MITTAIGLCFVIVMFICGFIHGVVWRFWAFWKRASLYVENDEYRIGLFALSIVGALFFIRLIESHVIYHLPLKEGWWPLVWAMVYCWGITSGFRHTRSAHAVISSVSELPDE
jgi:hypothetical protein